ncbi:hypothetical protein CCMA1212_006379 [Trichoderma ghanense]|uniref:Uncharacterized protein n=1 Tax=Trichoderma ghanense TaxID=65468 RepID=A0ABY2H0B9_9HYPO
MCIGPGELMGFGWGEAEKEQRLGNKGQEYTMPNSSKDIATWTPEEKAIGEGAAGCGWASSFKVGGF